MDLKKLFETQKILRDRIDYNEPDRFNKLVLALLVELGECANEWRGFKFWSKDQEPRLKKICATCEGKGGRGGVDLFLSPIIEVCEYCEGSGYEKDKNPLLEEYVDGLHFVLDLGIELDEDIKSNIFDWDSVLEENITDQFRLVFYFASILGERNCYIELFASFLNLGKMLGFTWKEVETAYYQKNQINHERQDNGY